MAWNTLFNTLYRSFIPEPYKPVRIQARNVLYTKPCHTLVKCSNHQWWKFGQGKCCCETKIVDPKCIVVSHPDMCRRCSFSTQQDSINMSDEESEKSGPSEVVMDQCEDEELPPIDRFIQACVEITGSLYTFIIVWIIIIVWVVIGIVQGGPNNWQIIMQDGQSIQTYIWNTFLMRQQLDDTHKFLKVYGRLKSRAAVLNKLMAEVKVSYDKHTPLCNCKLELDENGEALRQNIANLEEVQIVKLTWFERLSNLMTLILGSLPSIVVYWAGVFIWIGCGALYTPTGNQPPFTGKYTGSNPAYGKFTNQWQMYINTAVALELLITSVFLENLRLRNNKTVRGYFEDFINLDADLELELRRLTGYTNDNLPLIVRPMPRKGIEKWISFYAGAVGNGLGLVISTCVFVAWIAIGHVMHWNDNWWLIIGTYTGLVGFIDSVVLREVYYAISSYEDKMFESIVDESQQLLDISGFVYDLRDATKVECKGTLKKWNIRMSEYVNYVCSTKYAVIVSFIVVVGLIIMGCAMKWSETAQLIANTPTMIIEGFFLLILIQGHEMADKKRTRIVEQLTDSRRKLFQFLAHAEASTTKNEQF